MRKFITNLFATLVLLSPTMTLAGTTDAEAKGIEKRYIVKDDGGGVVSQFKESLTYFQRYKMPVKVDGYCASACTLLLSKDYKLDVCITKNTVFMFHQPFAAQMTMLGPQIDYSIPSIAGAEKLWREDFYGKYFDWVQVLIDKNGGVPSVYLGETPQATFDVGYKTLSRFMKTCA